MSEPATEAVADQVRAQNAEDAARWAGVRLAPSPEIKPIEEGPYRGFFVSEGKPDPALAEACRAMARESEKRRDEWLARVLRPVRRPVRP